MEGYGLLKGAEITKGEKLSFFFRTRDGKIKIILYMSRHDREAERERV